MVFWYWILFTLVLNELLTRTTAETEEITDGEKRLVRDEGSKICASVCVGSVAGLSYPIRLTRFQQTRKRGLVLVHIYKVHVTTFLASKTKRRHETCIA